MKCELKKIGRRQELVCEDVEGRDIFFRNFGGAAGNFNSEGKRSFNLRLPRDLAVDLAADGWNIRDLESEEYEPNVKVNINPESKFPVKMFRISGGRKTRIDKEDLADLDYDEIEFADLVINPYRNEEKFDGVSAYLQEGYFNVYQSDFEAKYAKYKDARYDMGGF